MKLKTTNILILVIILTFLINIIFYPKSPYISIIYCITLVFLYFIRIKKEKKL